MKLRLVDYRNANPPHRALACCDRSSVAGLLLVVAIGMLLCWCATPLQAATLVDLDEQAQRQGSVRVIVRLAIDSLSPGAGLAPVGAVGAVHDRLVGQLGDTVMRAQRFRQLPFSALQVNAAGLAALVANPLVVAIEEDHLKPPLLDLSTVRINADDVWAAGFSGQGQIVAVLDTGVDKNHGFISPAKVIAEACFSTSVPSLSVSSLCPNPDADGDSEGAGTGVNCTVSGCEHGTHVAGIAAGRGTAFSGVARDAKIVAIQVFSKFSDSGLCSSFGYSTPCILSYTSDQLAALEWVYSHRNAYTGFRFAAVNLSLGGGRYTNTAQCDADNSAMKTGIDNLLAVDIATIIAAGNAGYSDALAAPGCISSAISVGATNDADGVAGYSNSASFLKLLAPGSSIQSSIPGGGFSNFSGTSMAAPHVAGAWAVLRQLSPERSVGAIFSELQGTGVGILDNRNGIIKPRFDLLAAVQSVGLPAIGNDIFSDAFED